MRSSDTIADLAAALAKAQGAFANPEKDREVTVQTKSGGDYKFKYATFTAVVDSIRKPLSDNGLSFVQITGMDEQGHLITTRLLHSTGQWIEFDTPVFVNGPGAQAFGSGVTYAKRYALSTMLGVTADEDDDANASEGNKVDMRQRPMRAPAPAAPVSTRATKTTTNISDETRKEAAEIFVAQSIAAFPNMTPSGRAEWWKKNNAPLGRLETSYPALFDKLTVAFDSHRDNALNPLQAG